MNHGPLCLQYTKLPGFSFLLFIQFVFTLSVNVIVPEGSGVTLSCNDHNAPKIEDATFKWTFRSRASVSELQPEKSSAFRKPELYKSDEGEYECLMEGHLGDSRVRISKTYNLSVDTRRSFTQWKVITVTEGDVADLPCSPPPEATWTKDSVWVRKIKEGTLKPLQPLIWDENDDEPIEGVYWARPNEDLSIKIFSSKVQDAGIYHCQFQDGQLMVELIVEALPPPRCYGHTDPWELCEDKKSRTAAAVMSESLTDFATKLYSQLRNSSPKENLLFSPVSIAGVLSHLLLGARNETRTLMEDALCLPRGFSCSHKAMKVLREETQESLDMASQIFYNPEQTLNEAFINQSVEFYEAAPTMLSSNPEENMNMINSWVAEKTKHKIPKLLDTVDASSQLILVNAVYFLGKWKLKFDRNSPPSSFTTLDGDMIRVNTLYGARYPLSEQFFSSLKAQVAAFPLTGKNRLFILVPVTTSLEDLQAVERRMTDTVLREMAKDMAKVSPKIAEVTLPKLKLDISTDLYTLIEDIGLRELFNDPNLCGIFPQQTRMPVVLSDARHRASLTLSENGVEAAAATSLSFARSFNSFSALQPFILVLWSDQANSPLFMGRVTHP
ncbi:hypothetical protein ACEWY4_007302 [Coilia grayii]|uniref:Ig-like domain-containing protein n=1 Tax=Coilia grayii TaxID=363190 RepID=A0ABD1KFW2_9TELE